MREKRAIILNDNIAIRIKDVTKTFNIFYDKTNTLKEKLLFWNRFKRYKFKNKKRRSCRLNWC